MFTGIIEEIGTVKEFKKSDNNALITVECKKVLGELSDKTKLGDSIAINGVCQTVIDLKENSFSAQISNETLKVTTLDSLKSGEKVNLERALTLSSRLGGHMVTGHIDGTAKLLKKEKQTSFGQNFYLLTFEAQSGLSNYIVKKGSVCINGISLTVAEVKLDNFDVAIIPHTFENTNLTELKTGGFVNIEVDVLAKYVEKFLSTGNNVVVEKTKINESFLEENGFF